MNSSANLFLPSPDGLAFLGRGDAVGAMSEFAATSPQEQRFCHLFAAKVFKGVGRIVEFGPWLGSLTKALARGLSENRHVRRDQVWIEAYDRFQWDPFMEMWVEGSHLAGQHAQGELFVEEYRRQIRDVLSYVDVHVADLELEGWVGGPIELLVNDAWKSVPIVRNTVKQFFPSLIPGASHVIHQDYLWITESFIQVAMYRLREFFEFRSWVGESTMAVFRCVKELPGLEDFFPEEYWELSPEEIEQAHQWNLSILPQVAHPCLKASKAWMLAQLGEVEMARGIFRDIESCWRSLETLYQFQKSVLRNMDFGREMDMAGLDWCLRDCARWEAAFPESVTDLKYWDAGLDAWLWTSRELYPVFVDLASKRRFRYQVGSSRPRRFQWEDSGESLVRISDGISS